MPNEFFSWALITLSQQFYYLNSKFNGAFYYFFQEGGGGGCCSSFPGTYPASAPALSPSSVALKARGYACLMEKRAVQKKVIKLRAYFVRTPQWRGGKLLN